MQIELSDQTIRDVETLLAKRGERTSISEFVDHTVQRALFFESVREVKRLNTNADPKEIDRLIEEAVGAVRSKVSRAANGSART